MNTEKLTLEELEQRNNQNQNRMNRLQAQMVQRSIKEDKRLQILIGMATLAQCYELVDNSEQYRLKMNELKEMLDHYIPRERDREFLKEFGFL